MMKTQSTISIKSNPLIMHEPYFELKEQFANPKYINYHHPNDVNPKLKDDIGVFLSGLPDQMIDCFVKHKLKAHNMAYVLQMLLEEINDVMRALIECNPKEVGSELEDLTIKINCYWVLAKYTTSLFPS